MNAQTYHKMNELFGNWFFGMCSREEFVSEADKAGVSVREYARRACKDGQAFGEPITDEDGYTLDSVLDYVEETCRDVER